jgi:cyanophycinase
VGTSAGSMAMCSPIYGDGNSYGHLYFAGSIGLANKNISDGGINGTGTSDTRNGTSGLQYDYNGGMMIGFNFIPFLIDTHFDQRGRLGRMIPALVQMKKNIGIGVD